jgi:uncharacterized protein (TIGR00369 family)
VSAAEAIWARRADPLALQGYAPGTALEALGIEFTEVGPRWLSARMPVDRRTVQPHGLLHGGASVLLAETLASVAGTLCLPEGRVCLGLEINANHLRPVRRGWVTGRAEPLHLGRRTQVWEVRIADDAGRLVCVSRVTLAVTVLQDAAGGGQGI